LGTRVLVFESCVSRDPFGDLINPSHMFSLIDYYARSSFASLSGKPLSEHLDLSMIESPFQRRMVERDLSKTFLDLDLNEVDLIIIDFIDDRFPLIELEHGALCTVSDEFKKAELQLDGKKSSHFQTSISSPVNLAGISSWIELYQQNQLTSC